ncbi:putative pectinesterase/pectinesterase inhibitor 28 [Mangifera indica]|uniref:putative pectinesterase/pectinesterase inhibitor 28 n=1 Tax=Mangifera indica TaxID=29780 RepID=UPI001CFB2339|nr:putative pectinesterase/pectinesterase inhibitor 28 [Mangifera indica]
MANKTVFIGFGAVLLIAMVVSIGVLISRSSEKKDDSDLSTSTKAIKAVCEPTTYKETCQKSLEKKGGENVTNPKDLIKMEFEVAIDELKAALDNSSAWKEANKDPMVKQAFHNCRELLHDAIDDLHTSFGEMSKVDVRKADHYIENVKVFLSGAATFQESCLDQFENVTGDFGEKMKKLLNTSRELTSNGLAMMHDFSEVLNSLHVGQKERRLLSNDDFPDWVSAGRRRLLAEPPPADVVVAQDGSGKVKTIAEALALAPDAQNNPTNKPFIIHIKEGVYKEYVTVDKTKANVMFVGDGATKTKITGNKNFIDGVNTMNTATVAILGPNFIAKDMGFENSAGAEKHQAVALRVQADSAIFYNCQMDGYQDTLYAHAHRQYYRDCTITGTIDYIFGDAAAIFQNCRLIFRKPMANQAVIITAQGRADKNAVTGFVLQNCVIGGEPDYVAVKDQNKGYLGRPWKEFARTLYLQSEIGDVIQPEGWMPWQGDFALNTCWYAEFGNRGPGSDTARRVTWPGIQKINAQQAEGFTLAKFIGVDWIQNKNVPFTAGMEAA